MQKKLLAAKCTNEETQHLNRSLQSKIEKLQKKLSKAVKYLELYKEKEKKWKLEQQKQHFYHTQHFDQVSTIVSPDCLRDSSAKSFLNTQLQQLSMQLHPSCSVTRSLPKLSTQGT